MKYMIYTTFMPRPTRIEYEGAVHHVMNRGRGRQTIFHGEQYFIAFLETLKEASHRFDAIIHGYCLMTNHYHLLIETPKANLGRIMRHVNGIYTQRYNRLKQTDGPLFRGRFKSVLVDQDAYLLQLSRYIHRNPVETKKNMANNPQDYTWSSYPAYVNAVKCPEWLYREKIYKMLGHKQKYRGYKNYVARGVDEDLLRFYGKGNIFSVLGDRDFRESVRKEASETDLEKLREVLQDRPRINELVKNIAVIYQVDEEFITRNPSGRRTSNPARAFAMYAAQEYGNKSLKEIAAAFGLGNTGSASFSIHKTRKEIASGLLKGEIKALEEDLYIVKYD